ncbi:MAG: metallophosphoesterase family protein [Lentisphaeria bacterium]|nr:metallophosphoesterase family protein [Lentisphaeria bacterium]
MKTRFLTQKSIIRKERRNWSRLSSVSLLNCRGEFLPGNFLLKRFTLSLNPAGKKTPFRILFFTDTHIRNAASRSFFPYVKWKGSSLILENLRQAIRMTLPDALIFGGDLAGESALLPEGAALFASLDVKQKFAIYGNWDKKGNTALSYARRKKMLEESSVKLLVNEGVFLRDDLYLYGMDDARMGYPLFSLPEETAKESIARVIAVHSPDAVTGRIGSRLIRENDLFLCGHTHGGQIRMPLFGAFRTSTYSGKKLEMAWYEHVEKKAKMYVSCGIGTTFIHGRLFAPPEIVLLELV